MEDTPWIVVTGLDGSGKSTLVTDLAAHYGVRHFRLPFWPFVKELMAVSGGGSQFGDPYTDRLLHVVDSRLADGQIRTWRDAGETLVSQRGWLDHFVFGACQGWSYEQMCALLRPEDLSTASVYIHLHADPEIAYARIADDQDGDKFETLDFMRVQARETVRCWEAVRLGVDAFASFQGAAHLLLDTSELTTVQTFTRACEFLTVELGERLRVRA